MDNNDGDSEEDVYLSAADDEEVGSRPWTEDDETSVARPSSSSGRQASSTASLLSSTSFQNAAERPWRRLACAAVHLAWFDSLAALCVDALLFALLTHTAAFDLAIIALSALRAFGSLAYAAAFADSRCSERKRTHSVLLVLAALLLAVSVFSNCQTISTLLQIPPDIWWSSYPSRLHVFSCALGILGSLLYLMTALLTIAFLQESDGAFISPHSISRKRSRLSNSASDTSSHFVEL
jgi:hypothetical protein